MSQKQNDTRWGIFFQTGHWEKSLCFRVDDPSRAGWVRLICGSCVEESDAKENSRTVGGASLCEACRTPYGTPVNLGAALAKALSTPLCCDNYIIKF